MGVAAGARADRKRDIRPASAGFDLCIRDKMAPCPRDPGTATLARSCRTQALGRGRRFYVDELDRCEIAHFGLQRRASPTKRSRRAQDAKRLATPNARSGLRKGRVLRKFFARQRFVPRLASNFLRIGAQSPGSETVRLRLVDFAARVALKPHCHLTM